MAAHSLRLLVIFLDALDTSMMGVALPSIQADLGLSTRSLQWLVSGYVIGFGGFLLLGGRAADLLGRRKVFLVALAVFLITSGIGGIANDGSLLIASRFLKGVAAAFTAPAGLSIITTSFAEGPLRNRALALYQKPLTFAVSDPATHTVYKWKPAIGVTALKTRESGLASLTLGFEIPDLAKEIEWGPTINLSKGTCYWINPLILAAPRSG